MIENDNLKHTILEETAEIKRRISPKSINKLNLDLTERMVDRLSSLSSECTECKDFLNVLGANISDVREAAFEHRQIFYKEYLTNQKRLTAHLQKEHKLVKDGYYRETYMSIGIALGLPFGFIVSQAIGNIAYIGLGLPIGLSIGLSIGASLDEKAKKDGLVM